MSPTVDSGPGSAGRGGRRPGSGKAQKIADRTRDATSLSGPNVREVRRSLVEDQYPTYLRNNHLRPGDLTRLRYEASAFGEGPVFSLVVPVLDPGKLGQTLDSVLGQIYQGWEIRIACAETVGDAVEEILAARFGWDGRAEVVRQRGGVAGLSNAALSLAGGEFACVVNCGDELAPDALFELAKALRGAPDAVLAYTDEDRVDDLGRRSRPRFKPGWSPDLLLSTDYVSGLAVFRLSLLEDLGGFREGFEGAHAHDLALRATERDGGSVLHVPRVLYHRRVEAGTDLEGSRRAVSEALERRGVRGSVEDGLLPGRFRVRYEVPDHPKVSLIIPTRDNVSVLKTCVESIERLTDYRNYEVVIVDNDSADPGTVAYLDSTPHKVLRFKESFNYSKINNFAVSRSEGEYVLFLNDDTEVVDGGWLGAMVEHAQRPEVGAVGARLLYPDGRVQHAGVLVGVGNPWGPGIALHAHQFYPAESEGYCGAAMTVGNFSAVTAACVLMRRSVFEEVGRFDEKNLKVSFNDVDLCLKIRARGYLITYTPHAELLHHESASRGYSGGDPSESLYMRERWGPVLDADPYYNPNFSRGSGDYNLRADLLRPRTLRQDPGAAGEVFLSPLTMDRGDLEEQVKARQRAARSSPRSSIVPAPEKANGTSPRLESLYLSEGPEGAGEAAREASPTAKTPGALREEQLVWIFGSPRTGSTWLSRMMAELDNQERWHEPYVGLLFGSFVYERLGENTRLLNNPSFIMGQPLKNVWLRSIKNFVVEGAMARYPNLGPDRYLIVKEPNGSVGAPLMMEATPGSRMVFLIRDPRDVVASRLDAFKEGSWSSQKRDYSRTEELDAFTRHLAEDYLKVVSQVQRAYDAHGGPKVLIRYEDLRRDTPGTIGAMYRALGIPFDRGRLKDAVAKHSWENIPTADKGSGKFYRKAQPGSWKEDLSAAQISLVEEITGPVLERYYGPDARL